MGRVRNYELLLSPTGSAGAATAAGDVGPFEGKILAIDYIPTSMPVTTDVVITITEDDDNTSDIETVATFTDTNTLTRRVPKRLATTHDGSALTATANIYENFVTHHGVHVEVSQADQVTDGVKIHVVVEE